MTRWMALGPDQGGTRACLVDAGTLLQQGLFASADEARAALDAGTAEPIAIGGRTPHAVPTAILPESAGTLPSAVQDRPPDAISGWSRLRLAGVLAARPHWDGVIVETGPQAHHWIHVSADEIVSFQGTATPRLIAALGGGDTAEPEAVEATLSRPERLAAHLHGAAATARPAAITGHLIGAEIAASKPYWLGQDVIVLGTGDILQKALAAQGTTAVTEDPDAALARGLAVYAERSGHIS